MGGCTKIPFNDFAISVLRTKTTSYFQPFRSPAASSVVGNLNRNGLVCVFFFCYFFLQLYYQDYELKQRNGRVTNMTRHISWFGWRIKRSYLLRYERTGSKICGFLFFLSFYLASSAMAIA